MGPKSHRRVTQQASNQNLPLLGAQLSLDQARKTLSDRQPQAPCAGIQPSQRPVASAPAFPTFTHIGCGVATPSFAAAAASRRPSGGSLPEKRSSNCASPEAREPLLAARPASSFSRAFWMFL